MARETREKARKKDTENLQEIRRARLAAGRIGVASFAGHLSRFYGEPEFLRYGWSDNPQGESLFRVRSSVK
jgi:hypothetical protein